MKSMLSLSLSFGCLALVTMIPRVTYADAITFAFTAGNGSVLTADASGVTTSASSLKDLTVTDSASNTIGHLSLSFATVAISTGPATSFSTTGPLLSADFTGGAANVIEVELKSASCSTGTGGLKDVCLIGTENKDHYSATKGGVGSFQGVFSQVYLDPVIFAMFGASGLDPFGSDALTTSANTFNGPPLTLDKATLAGGNITIQTAIPNVVTPEPGSLLLLSTGLAGLALMLRWKTRQRN